MKILSSAWSTSEDVACDYAIIAVTPELATQLAARRHRFLEVKKQDDTLEAMKFRSLAASFYKRIYTSGHYPPKFEELLDEVEREGGYVEIPDDLDLAFLNKPCSRDDPNPKVDGSDVVYIGSEDFFWVCYIDGADLETSVPFTVLSKVI